MNIENMEFNVKKDHSFEEFIDALLPKDIFGSYLSKVIWAKSTPTAIIPTKTDSNAGFDMYADFDGVSLTIPRNSTVLVNTNVRCAIPEGYFMLLEERGSTGSVGIKRSAGVIDSNYRGNIQVAVYNASDKILILSKQHDSIVKTVNTLYYPVSKAIAQGVILPVPKFRHVEVSLEDFMKMETDRGEGMLGSSGK